MRKGLFKNIESNMKAIATTKILYYNSIIKQFRR